MAQITIKVLDRELTEVAIILAELHATNVTTTPIGGGYTRIAFDFGGKRKSLDLLKPYDHETI